MDGLLWTIAGLICGAILLAFVLGFALGFGFRKGARLMRYDEEAAKRVREAPAEIAPLSYEERRLKAMANLARRQDEDLPRR